MAHQVSDGEGRSAGSLIGHWGRFAFHAWTEFNDDQIPSVAAGVTFYVLLSLFPAIGAFVSLYGLFANVDDARRHIVELSGLLPGGAVSVIGDQLTRLAATGRGQLGVGFATGLIIALWSATSGVRALLAGLNVAYEQKEKRNFFVLNAVVVMFTVAAILLAIAALTCVVAAPEVLRSVGLSGVAGLSWVRWPAVFVIVTMLLSLLYRYGPCHEDPHWRWITPGGTFAAAGWLLMSLLFSWYVANFGHYDKIYGSLGALAGFMTWIWLSLIVVLLGAELNTELAREAAAPRTAHCRVETLKPIPTTPR
jgi:membrane protein